jgi:hypothetical protein
MSNLNAAVMAETDMRGLRQAVELLSNSGRITIMHVTTAAEAFPAAEVSVNSADLLLSPDTINGIKSAMQAQIAVLEQRLADAMSD